MDKSSLNTDWDQSLGGPATPVVSYTEWLARGKNLADKHSGYQWRLGDWICDGQEHFDFKSVVGEIPGYMLLSKVTDENGEASHKSVKIANFWKDVSAEIGLAESTVKDYAWVARSYPKKKRFKQLGFCHHMIVAGYERRYEYLQACIRPGEKPRSFAWLRAYALEKEGTAKSTNATIKDGGPLHLQIPSKFWNKLQDLRRYHTCSIADLVQKACFDAIDDYIETEARKISLKLFDYYEGRWPFELVAEKKSLKKQRRRRRMNDPVFSEKMRQVNIARHSRLGRVA
jgi:hypothetical protein